MPDPMLLWVVGLYQAFILTAVVIALTALRCRSGGHDA